MTPKMATPKHSSPAVSFLMECWSLFKRQYLPVMIVALIVGAILFFLGVGR